MEFKQLEFFLMCVECGSFGKAAERLYTTQPNVSRVIYALESELGNKIFERTSRGLRLTDYGKSIYNYALNAVKNTNLILETDSSNTKKRYMFLHIKATVWQCSLQIFIKRTI